MEILHIFSVTGNKNRKIWQEMEVEAEKMPPAAGRGRFLTLRGSREDFAPAGASCFLFMSKESSQRTPLKERGISNFPLSLSILSP